MEKELTKKEINRTIGEVTKALNGEDKSVLILTDRLTTGKGNLVAILAYVAKFLRAIREHDLIGKLAVDALTDQLVAMKKKEEQNEAKKLEEMSEEELLEELKKTIDKIGEIVK